MRLVGTTKPTIAQIRDRTHWNSPQLTPQDPVTLGLCSQTDLDAEVKKAARRLERERKDAMQGHGEGRHAAVHRGDDGKPEAASHAPTASICARSPRRSARGDAGGRAGARLRQAQGHVVGDKDEDDEDERQGIDASPSRHAAALGCREADASASASRQCRASCAICGRNRHRASALLLHNGPLLAASAFASVAQMHRTSRQDHTAAGTRDGCQILTTRTSTRTPPTISR